MMIIGSIRWSFEDGAFKEEGVGEGLVEECDAEVVDDAILTKKNRQCQSRSLTIPDEPPQVDDTKPPE